MHSLCVEARGEETPQQGSRVDERCVYIGYQDGTIDTLQVGNNATSQRTVTATGMKLTQQQYTVFVFCGRSGVLG